MSDTHPGRFPLHFEASGHLRRAFVAQARSFTGDLPLSGVCAAAAVLSASIAANLPPNAGAAPEATRALLAQSLSTVIGVYAAAMAAMYGSFRYTIDRRCGVVAQRATQQPRVWTLAGRIPFTIVGGALVAASALLGARLALAPGFGLAGLETSDVTAVVAVGATAAVWGFGIGLLVQVHLPSLFIAPLSLSAAMMVAALWPSVGAWLPLSMLLRGAGLDLAPLGVAVDVGPGPSLAALLAGGAVVAVLAVGSVSFLRRDLR